MSALFHPAALVIVRLQPITFVSPKVVGITRLTLGATPAAAVACLILVFLHRVKTVKAVPQPIEMP